MAESQGRILVIRGGAIGDFILTLPVLSALRMQFPQARLAVLGYPHIAGVALAGGLADEIHAIEARGLASFFNPRSEPASELAAFFAGFSVIISYIYDPDGVFQQSIRRCSSAVFIQGPHRPDESKGTHASDVFLKPLEQLAIFDADPSPRLLLSSSVPWGRDCVEPPPPPGGARPPPRRGEVGGSTAPPEPRPGGWLDRDHEAPTLAVHPGSGSERKNWPEPKWAELLERLAARADLDLLLIGGEAEGDRLERLAQLWPADRLQVARSLPLVQLAGLLAACRLFVGHDSGITHVAAALGLPGLVLWGETNEAIWRPRTDRMQLLRGAAGLDSLEVAVVEAALVASFDR